MSAALRRREADYSPVGHPPSPDLEHLLRQAEPLPRTRLSSRERLAEGALALLILAGIAGLSTLGSAGHETSLFEIVVLTAAFAVASRLRFNIGVADAAATQLVLVPMLLLLPPALVPALAAAGGIAARVPDYVRGRVHPDRALLLVGDAGCLLVPALVLGVAAPGPARLDAWPVYVLALATMVVADIVLTVLRAWLACGVPPRLQARLFVLVIAVDCALAPLGLLAALAAAEHPVAIALVLPLLALLASLAREREERIRQSLELSDAYRGTALLMGDVLEVDDAYTGGEHTHGVVALALNVGRRLGLDARAQRDLEFAAMLHDIGKLRVPDAIINKPGKLDPAEWEIMRRHPEDGQLMLERVGGVLAEVGKLVRWHHERWDGRGYPDGLLAEETPLISRIVCACDAFSAMTTDRSYRAGLPVPQALEELRACAGSQFDPLVVDALVAAVSSCTPAAVALPLALAS